MTEMCKTFERMSSEEAFDFMFFVNELNDADATRLKAATLLAEAKLRKGSRIDVWAEDRFWAAKITSVSANKSPLKNCGVRESGSVNLTDSHKTWHFPVDTVDQAAVADAIASALA
jgi:hypothetical protein